MQGMPLLEEKKKIGPPVKLTNTSIANARNAPPGREKKKKKKKKKRKAHKYIYSY